MDNFQDYYAKVMAHIAKKGVGVLATANQNVPMTRMVSFVVYDDKIAFQTSKKLEKYVQIATNSAVALNFTNINIQGKARIQSGQVLTHEKFRALFQEKHQGSFDTYSHMASNRVVEISPETIVLWEYEAGEPFLIFLDVRHQTFRKAHYDHTDTD
ncbi:MAG: pyridoxamine 5'-phosphate oxidase family protein [Pseudolactococcus laudensis]